MPSLLDLLRDEDWDPSWGVRPPLSSSVTQTRKRRREETTPAALEDSVICTHDVVAAEVVEEEIVTRDDRDDQPPATAYEHSGDAVAANAASHGRVLRKRARRARLSTHSGMGADREGFRGAAHAAHSIKKHRAPSSGGRHVHSRPARVITFSRDGAMFTVIPTASLRDAACIVYAAVGSAHDRDAEALELRISSILLTHDGADDNVYLHPADDDDGDAVVRYIVMYASRAAPVDASDAARMWEENAGRQRDELYVKVAMPNARPARVITFSRDGAVFTITPTATLMDAARIVFAAAGSTHYREGKSRVLRISRVLRTRDGADDKVYLHPVDDDGDAVVRYMVIYASRAAPVDASDAARMWEEYADGQRDEFFVKAARPNARPRVQS